VGCVQARVNEWSLLILPSPIPKLQHAPLSFKVLWVRERALTPLAFAVFYLDSLLSPSRSWECVRSTYQTSQMTFIVVNIGILTKYFIPIQILRSGDDTYQQLIKWKIMKLKMYLIIYIIYNIFIIVNINKLRKKFPQVFGSNFTYVHYD